MLRVEILPHLGGRVESVVGWVTHVAVQQPRARVVSNEVSGADDGGQHPDAVRVPATHAQHVAVEVHSVHVYLVTLLTFISIRSAHGGGADQASVSRESKCEQTKTWGRSLEGGRQVCCYRSPSGTVLYSSG